MVSIFSIRCTGQVSIAALLLYIAPSGPPTEVSFDEVTSVGLALSWSYPPEDDINGQIRHFLVNISEEITGTEYILTTMTNSTEVNFLHPFYTYLCSVSAVTVSAGPYSLPIPVTTLPSGEKYIQRITE